MAEAKEFSFNFEKLQVWQEAMQWASKVHTGLSFDAKTPEQEDTLVSLKRTAREVPLLIAEGKNYYLNKILQSFLRRSKSQLYRTATLLLLTQSLGWISAKQSKPLLQEGYGIARQIGGLIRYLAKEEQQAAKPAEA